MKREAKLREEQALILQTINGLRDAAQHHLLDVSEGQLHVHVQSGVTLFRDLLKSVFDQDLSSRLPSRVLPVSTSPPTDLATLFDSEVSELKKLLRPGRRRRIEALARRRPLAILDGTIRGEKGQPSDADLRRLGNDASAGRSWSDLFPGAAAVEITADGTGPGLSLRLSRKEGIPIQLVAEGTPGASVVGVKRVDELGFYNLGAKQVAEKAGLTMPKALAVVDHVGLRNEPDFYKEIKIGRAVFKRYSAKAVEAIKTAPRKEPGTRPTRRPARGRATSTRPNGCRPKCSGKNRVVTRELLAGLAAEQIAEPDDGAADEAVQRPGGHPV